MDNKELVTIVVQGAISVLLVLGSLILLAMGQAVPDWVVNVVLVVIGYQFAGATLQRVRINNSKAPGRD